MIVASGARIDPALAVPPATSQGAGEAMPFAQLLQALGLAPAVPEGAAPVSAPVSEPVAGDTATPTVDGEIASEPETRAEGPVTIAGPVAAITAPDPAIAMPIILPPFVAPPVPITVTVTKASQPDTPTAPEMPVTQRAPAAMAVVPQAAIAGDKAQKLAQPATAPQAQFDVEAAVQPDGESPAQPAPTGELVRLLEKLTGQERFASRTTITSTAGAATLPQMTMSDQLVEATAPRAVPAQPGPVPTEPESARDPAAPAAAPQGTQTTHVQAALMPLPGISPAAAASADAQPAALAPDTARQLGDQGMQARIDLANEAQLMDRIARDVAQLGGRDGKLSFRLNPENLGSLHVEVAQQSDGVSLRFGTETESARAILADAQHRLVNEARAQGMRIAETHIDLGSRQMGQGREGQPQQGAGLDVVARGASSDGAAEPQTTPARSRAERFA